MKKLSIYCKALAFVILSVLTAACSEYEPFGYTEAPELAKATNVTYTIGGTANHEVTINWTLPNDKDVTGCVLYSDAQEIARFNGTNTTTYTVLGQPLGEEVVYTVKVLYTDNRISLGTSALCTLPAEDLAGVSNLKGSVKGRTVTLSWTLPSAPHITGIKVYREGLEAQAMTLAPTATSIALKGQPMAEDLIYHVDVVYDTYYVSTATATYEDKIPYVAPKMLYLLLANTPDALPDDDELAAAAWFGQQENAEFVKPADLANYDPDLYPVLWIEIDRVGMPMGWQNLPSGVTSDANLQAIKNYSANGGNIFLANFATQLTVPLGFVPDNMAPTVYGNGDGGNGDDVWVINPQLGIDFKNGGSQGFYDRTTHKIFEGLTLEDPNNYGYMTLPLIGPGRREDHNCLWDCNIYGKGNQKDVIRNFEDKTNSMVLATWGHVRDHCVAGLVEFYSNADHGKCIAMGLAAYEWNQNSGVNPYQHNVEQLTANILNYLK